MEIWYQYNRSNETRKNDFIISSNGIYRIGDIKNNIYFEIKNNDLILSKKQSNFRFILIQSNSYYIKSRANNKILGINKNNKITIKKINEQILDTKNIWNLYRIYKNNFLIQNKFSENFIEIKGKKLQCNKNIFFSLKNLNKTNKKEINFAFNILKLFEEKTLDKKYENFVKFEPIDVVIKFIDLSDKSLIREGIKQIYKDIDNEELKYSIRSILQYIPWVRKIFILMPNKYVKFLKSVDEIKEKIIYSNYIKDKELLGYDSANIFAFTFNLYKLNKFGVSNNFIYMEDDFFIGQALTKKDFFYYDENTKKILPYLLTYHFIEINKSEVFNNYNEMFKNKNRVHPHSNGGWQFSIYSTEKYFIERYNNSLIKTYFTHNAIAKNIDDLKLIFKEIQSYEYINETLFSKERNILTLNQPHFYNLYILIY